MKLTPNRRLAIYLQGFSLNTWLEAQYAELCLADPALPYRLSSSEEMVIWEKIIATSDIGKSLLKTSSTAHLAREAWLLSVQWGVLSVESTTHTEDSLAFAEWAGQYQALCQKKHWVDSATVVNQLIRAIDQKKMALPEEIMLIGFEELTPKMAYFFEKIKVVGTRVKSESLVSKPGRISRLPAGDAEEELRFAVLKSKQWLDQNPTARIGIVVPELEKQRRTVVRLLEEVFCSESFNVAAPEPLNRYPLIDSALLAINFLLGEISVEKLSCFLRAPFFRNALLEQNIRAMLDVKIRGFSEVAFTLENAVKKIEYCIKQEPKIANFTGLAHLRRLVAMRTVMQGKQPALFWRNRFSEMLSCLGWPGDRLLTPEELEIQEQWEKLLADYVGMDRVLGEHRYAEALSYLQRLVQNTSFSPASSSGTRGSAPVQVLGILEALGLPFDYIWVTGLHREAWPPDPAPNPLLPLSLQRQYDLPRSSAARELKMARQFTERLSQGGKEVVFSYPTTIEERTVLASSLIAHFPEVSLADLGLSKPKSFLEKCAENSDNATDKISAKNFLSDQPLAVGATEKIKGGTSVLKLQALCPFRAFAEIRLQAKPIPMQSLGLSAAARGEIIHQVLDHFWQGLTNQTQLLALSPDILESRIQSAIETIFAHWQARYPRTLTPQYLSLEKKRTYELIERFIELEKSRPYFEIVSQEKTGVVHLEDLDIKIRIDRIDRLADQSEILLDYKTGEVSISNWFGERPRDPQLPLYCVTRDPKPTGIVFGVIRPDAIKYQGLVAEEGLIPDVKTPEKAKAIGCAVSFAEQTEAWEISIASLAREFVQGVARVDPIDGENTCRTCSLKPLCRVHADISSS